MGIKLGLIGVLILYQWQKNHSYENQLLYGSSNCFYFKSRVRKEYKNRVVGSQKPLLNASYYFNQLDCWWNCIINVVRSKIQDHLGEINFIFLSSLPVLGIVNFLMLAVQRGDASTVIPIANMSFVIVLLVPVVSKMEILTAQNDCNELCDHLNYFTCPNIMNC